MNIAGGDWRFFFPENVINFSGIPSAWDSSLNSGVGQPQLNTLWITGYLYMTSLLSRIGFSWDAIGLLCWIIPSILIGFLSMYLLSRFLWDCDKKSAIISSLVYIGNTYFLMVFSGGQLGVALSYGMVPLVVFRFLKNVEKPDLRNSIFFGLVFSFQLLFDPRIFFITCILLGLYLFMGELKAFFKAFKYTILLPLILIFLTHGYWVVPILLYYAGSKITPTIYASTNDFSFFSFAKLENTISLLHPNWPENIFGRVHFMRPEFILIPTIAFVSLLNNNKKQTKKIVTITLVLLLFIFLAKGVNDPFGFVYLQFLKSVPGFSMFRDPTKFYIPIAFCYALLIPVGLKYLVSILSKFKKLKKKSNNIVFISFAILWIVLSFPLFQGKVTGIFKLRTVSSDYIQYKKFITQQPEFYRTLWIPQIQRFGYFSNNHPAIGRGEIFKDQSMKGMLHELSNPNMEQRLSELSVKYVVVPSDTEGEIFVDDGKFDRTQYALAINKLEKIPYLTKDRAFGSIILFKTKGYEEHFRFAEENSNGRIKIISSSPNFHRLSILPSSNDVLIFGDTYDSNWIMRTGIETIKSKSYHGLNSFVIPNNDSYNIEISYEPQNWVSILFLVSISTFGIGLVYISVKFTKKKND